MLILRRRWVATVAWLPGAIVGLGIAIVATVGSDGEFPLGDDWSYAGTVQRLVDEGRLQFGNWQSVPLIPQFILGSLVSLVGGGFSFEALRISTFFLWGLGALALISTFRDLEIRRSLALVGVLTFALNPIVVWLSFSFMADVPAAAFCALTVAGLVRHARTRSHASLAVAVAGAAMATLTRQSGLALFVAIAAVQFWLGGLGRASLARALFLVVSGATILWGTEQILARTVGLPALYYLRHEELQRVIMHGGWSAVLRGVWWVYCAAIYLAIFLLPPLLCVPTIWWTGRRDKRVMMFIAIGVLAVPIVLRQRLMPLLGNIINREGLGVPLLGDMALVEPLPSVMWWSATAIGVIALAVLWQFVMSVAVGRRRNTPDDRLTVLAIFGGVLTVLFIALHAVIGFYDRYLVFLLPPLICLIVAYAEAAGGPHRWQRRVATAYLVIVGAWAILASADSMAINRARWELLRVTQARGVASDTIDGGFEYNGWITGSPHPITGEHRWLTAFGPQDGYLVEDRRTLDTWLRGTVDVFVLRRR